jgi:hypothetical protein
VNAEDRPESRSQRSVTTEPSVPETDDTKSVESSPQTSWPCVAQAATQDSAPASDETDADPHLAARRRAALARLAKPVQRPGRWRPAPRNEQALDDHVIRSYGEGIAREYGVRRRPGPGHR